MLLFLWEMLRLVPQEALEPLLRSLWSGLRFNFFFELFGYMLYLLCYCLTCCFRHTMSSCLQS